MYMHKLPNELLWEKVNCGDANGARRALAGKANPNAPDENRRGETALHKAAEQGFAEVAKTLFQYRADASATDRMYTQIPLHRAADKGHTVTVAVLLEGGSDPNAQDRYGETPLHKVDAKSSSGLSPLLLAAQNGHSDACRLLLGSACSVEGASVGSRDSTFGWTALHFAAAESHESTIACLIEGGANPNTKDEGGRTAMHCAKTPAIRMLVSRLSTEYEMSKLRR